MTRSVESASAVILIPPLSKGADFGRTRPPSNLMPMGTLANGIIPTLVVDGTRLGLSLEKLAEYVASLSPGVLGISVLTPIYPNAIELAERIRVLCPEITTIIGGKHPTIATAEVVEGNHFDFIVAGEGEHVLPKMLRALRDHKESPGPLKGAIEAIKGVTFKGDRRSLESADPVNISSLPPTNWGILRPFIKDYIEPGQSVAPEDSRGCVHECTYCTASNMRKRKVSFRDPLLFAQEVEQLQRLGVDTIFPSSDDAFINSSRIMILLDSVKNIPVSLELNTRADSFLRAYKKYGENFLIALKDGHVKKIHMGVESGDEKIMQMIKKNINMGQVREVVRIARAQGIEVETNWIIGLPEDSEDSMQNTIDAALSIRQPGVTAHVSYFIPYPGTEETERANNLGLINPDEVDWSKMLAHGSAIIPTKYADKKIVREYYRRFVLTYYSDEYLASLSNEELDEAMKMKNKLLN